MISFGLLVQRISLRIKQYMHTVYVQLEHKTRANTKATWKALPTICTSEKQRTPKERYRRGLSFSDNGRPTHVHHRNTIYEGGVRSQSHHGRLQSSGLTSNNLQAETTRSKHPENHIRGHEPYQTVQDNTKVMLNTSVLGTDIRESYVLNNIILISLLIVVPEGEPFAFLVPTMLTIPFKTLVKTWRIYIIYYFC